MTPVIPRESRLLLVTLVVSVVVLLVLARIRFPPDRPPEPPAAPQQPLERLAARATYDELAGLVRQAESRLDAYCTAIDLRQAGPAETRGSALPPASGTTRRVAAIRVRPGVAVVADPVGETWVPVDAGRSTALAVRARDWVRRLALIDAPSGGPSEGVAPIETRAFLQSSRYVLLVEPGAGGGCQVTPVFLARSSPRPPDAWWRVGLFDPGAAMPQAPGGWILSLEGRLAGLLVAASPGVALVPPDAIVTAIDLLSRGGHPVAGDIGVVWASMPPSWLPAASSARGVFVREVEHDGPAAGQIEPGSVVTAIDGRPVSTIEEAAALVMLAAPGRPLRLSVARRGEASDVTLVPRAGAGDRSGAAGAGVAGATRGLGLTLRRHASGSLVTGVDPSGAAAHAGVAAGDLVVRAGDADRPSPLVVGRRYDGLTPGEGMLLVVRRERAAVALVVERR